MDRPTVEQYPGKRSQLSAPEGARGHSSSQTCQLGKTEAAPLRGLRPTALGLSLRRVPVLPWLGGRQQSRVSLRRPVSCSIASSRAPFC